MALWTGGVTGLGGEVVEVHNEEGPLVEGSNILGVKLFLSPYSTSGISTNIRLTYANYYPHTEFELCGGEISTDIGNIDGLELIMSLHILFLFSPFFVCRLISFQSPLAQRTIKYYFHLCSPKVGAGSEDLNIPRLYFVDEGRSRWKKRRIRRKE